MGASGAGKTSLLNVLCGRAHYGTAFGDVVVNGQKRKVDGIKTQIGFVPQTDAVQYDLTVAENLFYAGRVRLPKATSDEEVSTIVQSTLELLLLSPVQVCVTAAFSFDGVGRTWRWGTKRTAVSPEENKSA